MRGQLLTEKLKKGEIGVIPTDTIYGYRLRRRNLRKPIC